MAKPITIHTIDSLKKQCIEIGDCWIWQGYHGNHVPQVYHEGRVRPVRRVMHHLKHGVFPEARIFVGCTCGERSCVNPEHSTQRQPKHHMRYMSKQVDHLSVERRMKIRDAAKRRGVVKLDDEQLKEIHTSDLSSAELARRMKVNKSLVSSIRRGSARSLHNQTTNPFAGLMK